MSGNSIGYIGSKISLISRSDIRYVGILHSINQADSTVALEQVRSYGTEGRRENPAEEIPPSDNVFEYIVFRGSDVKDLHVCEAPTPQQSMPQVPNDPAILGTTAPRPPNFQGFAPPPPLGVQPPPNFPGAPLSPFYLQVAASLQQQQYWQQQQRQQQQQQTSQSINNISENANKEAEQPKTQQQKGHTITEKSEDHKIDRQTSVLKQLSKTATSSRTQSSTIPTTSNHRNEPSATSSANPSHVSTTHSINTTNTSTKETPSTVAVENLAKKVSELSVSSKEVNGDKHVYNNRSTSSNNKLPGMGGHLVQQNRRGRGSRRSYNQSYDRNRIPVPQSDFDFESSNAKFNKEEIVKEVVKKTTPNHDHNIKEDENTIDGEIEDDDDDEVLIPPPESFYDKTKSFFDNISCETKERLEQHGPDGRRGLSVAERRQKQSEERRLNLETFGQVSIDGGRYRGGYRSRGYRGGRGSNGNSGYRGGNRGRGGGSGVSGSSSGGNTYRNNGYSNNFRGNSFRSSNNNHESHRNKR